MNFFGSWPSAFGLGNAVFDHRRRGRILSSQIPEMRKRDEFVKQPHADRRRAEYEKNDLCPVPHNKELGGYTKCELVLSKSIDQLRDILIIFHYSKSTVFKSRYLE